jgi:hypothetical protein
MTSRANQSFQTGSAGYGKTNSHCRARMLTAEQEETAPPRVVKKPNPQNVKNQNTLQELEEEVRRYVALLRGNKQQHAN